MKLVKNSDITLTVDGNGVPIFFEPVMSQQTVLCIEGHKRMTFEVLLTDFLWATFWRTGSKKMGTPSPLTVSVISLFLTSFMVT